MKVKNLLVVIIFIFLVAGVTFYWIYTQHQEDLWKKVSIISSDGYKVVYGPGQEPFNHPTGINVEEDYIYVVDSDNHRIRVFDRAWEEVRSFGGFGPRAGQLGYPIAVCVTENQEIVVSEIHNNRVQVFSKEGKFLKEFPAPTDIIAGPSVMVCDEGQEVYIFDKGSQQILVFDSQGKLLRRIGDDRQTGGLRFVMGMDVDRDGNLIVADSGNRAVRIYSPEGELLERLLRGYNGVPLIGLPRGIASIDRGKFALVDALSRKVYIMQKVGQKWQSKTLEHDFVLPDSADYRDGKLYVTDRGDNCIVVFDLK